MDAPLGSGFPASDWRREQGSKYWFLSVYGAAAVDPYLLAFLACLCTSIVPKETRTTFVSYSTSAPEKRTNLANSQEGVPGEIGTRLGLWILDGRWNRWMRLNLTVDGHGCRAYNHCEN
ncbi:MAG: hypothetical protein QF473_22295 [Planctomycetota bacterium]|nr:hypothetical protein [Planctomycetota bacterium]MDP6505297.1 hypothetical protein [Planctomycetota bacterium]